MTVCIRRAYIQKKLSSLKIHAMWQMLKTTEKSDNANHRQNDETEEENA